MKTTSWILPALLATGVVLADDAAKAPPSESQQKNQGPKLLDGMSILGNQEAPKALVIVPWKGSELGASLGIAPMLDDSRGPVDRDVFLRALSYYEIRSETTHHEGAPAGARDKAKAGNDAAPIAKAAHRSKS